ncbi:hypothetical protein Tcan_05649 [Toxocara canis]|uniref:Uncharacterized protein n=1 Tax=Toxocara canis TaxID=6265 RepID=A0A0B2VRM0_TOXCA|nr:hypothetical protein Tcan_05649 [Toxocara canis]
MRISPGALSFCNYCAAYEVCQRGVKLLVCLVVNQNRVVLGYAICHASSFDAGPLRKRRGLGLRDAQLTCPSQERYNCTSELLQLRLLAFASRNICLISLVSRA